MDKRATPSLSEASYSELKRLEALARYEVLDTPPEAAFDRITALASKLFAVPIVLVSLLDRDRQWFKACYGLDVRQTDRSLSFCAHAILTEGIMVVPDATCDVRFANNALVTREPHIRFYAGAPLKAPDGVALGTLCIIDTQPRKQFSDAEQSILTDLAAIVVDELELRHASKALQASETRFRQLAENINDVFWISDIPAGGSMVYVSPAFETVWGRPVQPLYENLKTLFDGIHPDDCARVATAFSSRAAERQREYMEYRVVQPEGAVRWVRDWAFPVFDEHGVVSRLVGVAEDITEQKHAQDQVHKLTRDLEQLVKARTAELADANAQLRHDAFHDKLTGLPNRALFLDRLSIAIERHAHRNENGFAVLFLDADRFKTVNDSLGHSVGDQLLINLGKRLQRCVRAGNTVARLGGDEFTILLQDISGEEEALQAAARIQEELNKPFLLDNHRFYATASVGIVTSEMGYTHAEEVLRDADIAMYRAKGAGKARYQLFTKTMRARAASRLTLENDLRNAVNVNNDELRVHYQPIMSLTDGRLSGFEALVRWSHPILGPMSPDEFIPIAEETGLIIELDCWVLQTACRQLSVWQQVFPQSQLSLNVNLSSQQFLRPDLTSRLSGMLAETGVLPQFVKLELTETVLMQPAELVTDTLEQLRTLGVQLAIDDFGTGYSSLSYLHRFPMDVLKIDRSFVSEVGKSLETAELVRTILAMAHTLHLQVVAEGIETPLQLAQLKTLGCEFGQGYLFSKPLSVSEATDYLQRVTLGVVV